MAESRMLNSSQHDNTTDFTVRHSILTANRSSITTNCGQLYPGCLSVPPASHFHMGQLYIHGTTTPLSANTPSFAAARHNTRPLSSAYTAHNAEHSPRLCPSPAARRPSPSSGARLQPRGAPPRARSRQKTITDSLYADGDVSTHQRRSADAVSRGPEGGRAREESRPVPALPAPCSAVHTHRNA